MAGSLSPIAEKQAVSALRDRRVLDNRRTPDLSDRRPGCQNIARTDRDIDHIRNQAAELTQIAGDPFSPAPLHERERRELTRLRAIIAEHDGTRPHADVPA